MLLNWLKREYLDNLEPYRERLTFNEKKYHDLGFISRFEALSKLNTILRKLNLGEYDENKGLFGEHLIIFSALSESKNQPKKILEIGTYDGITSLILSELFPNSEICTLDLKDDDPLFINSYKRKFNFKEFCKDRNNRISKVKNIDFIQMNSLFLTIKDIGIFDLIWVDGAHGYPVASIDIANSFKMAHKDTIVMCDDVWKKIKKSDAMYNSVASWETLKSFEAAKIITNTFFKKRITKERLLKPKFISLSKFVKEF